MKEVNEEYKRWLETLGFSAKTVKIFSGYINEMLLWLEDHEIQEIQSITEKKITTYFFHWQKRKNKTSGAGLGQGYINTGVTAINNFIKFLRVTGRHNLALKLSGEKAHPKLPQVLTQEEMQALYKASHNNNRRVNTEAYGQRDRAMLAVYYGCGLRRTEGLNLLVSDVLQDKKMLFVRKGKGNKERFVPLTDKGLQDINEYLNYGRKWFLEERQKKSNPQTDIFFISAFGWPMQDFTSRIRQLKAEAGINKSGNLHVFRHSIATHLLQRGMDIEQIKKFLGHSSLESTQIYTHIINEF